MSTQTLSRRIMLLLGGVLLSPAAILMAQEDDAPGIIRITAAAQPAAEYVDHSQAQAAPESYVVWGEPEYIDCRDGNGKLGLKNFSLCTVSAGHGWAHPQRRPIIRHNTTYQHFWPTYWYGTRPATQQPQPHYPSVAMPTDTSQLGFYYQHVPHWVPTPSKLPPFPKPWQIHTRYCDQSRCNNNGCWTCPDCGRTHCSNGMIIEPGETIMPQADPNMTPSPQMVPPAPSENGSTAGRFQRKKIIVRKR